MCAKVRGEKDSDHSNREGDIYNDTQRAVQF